MTTSENLMTPGGNPGYRKTHTQTAVSALGVMSNTHIHMYIVHHTHHKH